MAPRQLMSYMAIVLLLAHAVTVDGNDNLAGIAYELQMQLSILGPAHVFGIFDYDGKGHLDQAELIDLVRHVLVTGGAISDNEVTHLAALIASDAQGRVTTITLERFASHAATAQLGGENLATELGSAKEGRAIPGNQGTHSDPFPHWELNVPHIRGEAPGVKVTVHVGPENCTAEERVKQYDLLEFSYSGRISIESQTGEIGKVFYDTKYFGNTVVEIGFHRVIRGWDEGLVGLCVGHKATLVVPPEMGYGDFSPSSVVPGGATLEFMVEIISVRPAAKEPNAFQIIDEMGNNDGRLTFAEIERWFTASGTEPPDRLMLHEDKNSDGFVSWLEFTGPKGLAPPRIVDGVAIYNIEPTLSSSDGAGPSTAGDGHIPSMQSPGHGEL